MISVVLALALASEIHWQPWSPEVFARAKAEHRFVLLDLGAVWCHWCHVMDEVTYQDAEVEKLIGASYIAVRADQDQHPDLANRYEDYGWPATIVFAADGSEIVRRRGYMNPTAFASMLQAIIDDPTPGPSVFAEEKPLAPPSGALSHAQREAILKYLDEGYDAKHGGWGFIHKYVETDAMELTLSRAALGDTTARAKAKQTLDANLALIDPKDGGVYQYSDLRKPEAPWGSPHFEKIMWYETQDLRLYALASKILDEPKYLEAAKGIASYLAKHLSREDGAFYASEDADTKKVDTRVFARENGWAIAALALLSDLSGDRAYVDRALRAAAIATIVKPRDGVLADHLALAQAYAALHRSTGDAKWLARAVEATKAIDRSFRAGDAGYVTAPVAANAIGVLAAPVRQIDENTALARLANLLAQETADPALAAISEHAMRYLAAPAITSKNRFLAGLILADDERRGPPLHITVHGGARDEKARQLYDVARSHPRVYAWVERAGGESPVAYACDGEACATPSKTPDELRIALQRLCALKATKL